jgi:hypothetical protein
LKTLFEAGARLQRTLDDRGWRFCFIGGVANFRWGTPRLTADLDLTLLTGFSREAEFARILLTHLASRIPDPMEFAERYRVLLLRTEEGMPVDIALGAMPFEERSIERSSLGELVPGVLLRTCSAEDLIVHKTFAGRPQDWVDVEGVILRQGGRLDWPQMWTELRDLAALKEEPEMLTALARIAERAESVVGPFEWRP